MIQSYAPTVHGPMTTSRRTPTQISGDSEYTNLGLVQCMEDRVPVGVFRQIARRPSARYRILGLAAVVGWEAGYFHLEGFSTDGLAYGRRAQAEIDALVQWHENNVLEA